MCGEVRISEVRGGNVRKRCREVRMKSGEVRGSEVRCVEVWGGEVRIK